MHLTEMIFDGPTPIDGYGPGFFRINRQVHQGGILLLPGRAEPWRGLGDWDRFLQSAAQIDVVFLGMGAEISALSAEHRRIFDEAGLGVEVMSSPAACRTYNVLLSEGRRIAAGLLPV
jgi:uncharacterized protein